MEIGRGNGYCQIRLLIPPSFHALVFLFFPFLFLFLFLLLNSTAEGTIKGRILDSPAQKKRKEIKEKKERKKGLAALIDHSKMIISWLA
jgi:hypothetical protein